MSGSTFPNVVTNYLNNDPFPYYKANNSPYSTPAGVFSWNDGCHVVFGPDFEP